MVFPLCGMNYAENKLKIKKHSAYLQLKSLIKVAEFIIRLSYFKTAKQSNTNKRKL